jgi:hypothetical protein
MRTLLKMQLPTGPANRVIQEGRLEKLLAETAAALKAESAYFGVEDGKRTMWAVFDLDNPAKMPPLFEPAFLELEAEVYLTPVMNSDQLRAGLGALG